MRQINRGAAPPFLIQCVRHSDKGDTHFLRHCCETDNPQDAVSVSFAYHLVGSGWAECTIAVDERQASSEGAEARPQVSWLLMATKASQRTPSAGDSDIRRVMSHRMILGLSILAACHDAGMAAEQQAAPPRTVSVLPSSSFRRDNKAPSQDQSKRLMRHLKWSQTRYRELLGHGTTFAIAEQKPRVYRSQRPLEFYRPQEGPRRRSSASYSRLSMTTDITARSSCSS